MNDSRGRHAVVLAAHQPLLAKHNVSWRILIFAVMAVVKAAGLFFIWPEQFASSNGSPIALCTVQNEQA